MDIRAGSLDVTKQADMSGFYRHLYNQTFAEPAKETKGGAGDKDKTEKKDETVKFKKDAAENKKGRQYRARGEENEEEEEEIPKPTEREPREESEPEEPSAKPNKKQEQRPAASAALVSAAATDRAAAADRAEKAASGSKKPVVDVEPKEESDSSSDDEDEEEVPPPPPPPKVKIDIWKKRTEGHLLEEAIQRYQQRKEAREQGLIAWPWF